MFHLVSDFLRTQGWARWSVTQIETDGLVWWIFPEGAASPALIGKLPRTPRDSDLGRREAAALAILAPYAARLNVPRLVFQTDAHDGRFIFLQSGMPGRPLAEETEALEPVLDWLEQLQDSVPPRGNLAEASCEAVRLCRALLRDPSRAEEHLLASVEAGAPALASLPAVAVHGDFWTGNLLQDKDRLAVVDWSNFHFGSPLEDLHNFAAAQGFRRGGTLESEMQSMWRVFFAETPLSTRTQDATRSRLRRGGLSAEMLQPLFRLFLARRVACVEFCNHASWRRFVEHYVDCGMPEPFTTCP